MRESLRQYCQRMGLERLLNEFDSEANAPLTPDDVSYGSARVLWWRCAEGHRWQAAPDTRRGGSACPICAGKRPDAGSNDLLTVSPELAAEWDPDKNGTLTPRDVLPGSRKLIWWRCGKGHGWTDSPYNRARGRGCPVCAASKETPGGVLSDSFPALAREWHPTRNGALTPRDVLIGSAKRVWWRCEQGHDWQASVESRTAGGAGCPVCAGKKIVPGVNDLATTDPKLIPEWAKENGPLRPSDVGAHSARRVWWTCKKGHLWRCSVADRVEKGSACPYCAGRRIWPRQRAQTPAKTPKPPRELNIPTV